MFIKEVNEKDLISIAVNFEYLCFCGIHNYLIYDNNNKIIGYLCGEKNNNNLFIDLFEVKSKGKGIGKLLVPELFNQLNLDSISGKVLYEDSHRPFYFWKSLGADISFESYIKNKNSEVGFELLNPNLVFA